MSNCSRKPLRLLNAASSSKSQVRYLSSTTAIHTPNRRQNVHPTYARERPPPAPPPKSSTLRRNAHALASSELRYDDHPPPPPPPQPQASSTRQGARSGYLDFASAPSSESRESVELPLRRAESQDRDDRIRDDLTPPEPSRQALKAQEMFERELDMGFAIESDESEGDDEIDWNVVREQTRRDTGQTKSTMKGKAKGKEVMKEEPIVKPVLTTRAKKSALNPSILARETLISSKSSSEATLETIFPVPTPRQPSTSRLILRPSQRLPRNTIVPYTPDESVPSTSYYPTVHPLPQPQDLPLLSRADWRLSSPARKYLRSSPPPLWTRKDNSTESMGHNRLVGVGIETARIAKGYKSREVGDSEGWGWKVKVPKAERAGWMDCDLYKKRQDRLLLLSRTAEEEQYRETLARQGRPIERERLRKTLCRSYGKWLTDPTKAEEMVRIRKEDREKLKKEDVGDKGGRKKDKKSLVGWSKGNGSKAVASFRAEDGRDLSEAEGWAFSPENTIVRITRSSPLSSDSLESDPNGPQTPNSTALDRPKDAWFVQGTVLEARESELVVSFEETDMWVLEEDEAYQIDVGLDESSYSLQEQAIENLYFDPARQRTRNANHVEDAQNEFTTTGLKQTLREWSLQGTDLRELLVPKSDEMSEEQAAKRTWEIDEDDLFDEGPLPPRPPGLIHDSITSSSTYSSRPLNPSELFTKNQHINSWAKRYMRDNPIVMPGDPDLGLNESQTKAVAMAIGEKLSLIQGPPGTGKSQTIVSLIALLKLHFRIPQPILLAAPTHVSTDHLLTLLVRRGLNPLRCGRSSRVGLDIEKWTIEKRQEQHPLWTRMEEARLESETMRDDLKKCRAATALIAEPRLRKEAEKRDDELEQRFRKMWKKFIVLEQRLYSSLLATADVFCATALGSGASKVLNMIDFPIVFIDEAAMCTEPVTLIPMMKGAQQVALIGDHRQLPAVVASQEAKNERLHISLFERLLASDNGEDSKINSVLLDTQYRMRPAISAFPNSSFYRSALKDADAVSNRSPPPRSLFFADPTTPVAFVTHTGFESTSRQSTVNHGEVDTIVDIVGDLLARNPALDARDIGIISPYQAQYRLLSETFSLHGRATKRLSSLIGRSRATELEGVEINTVDGFQGREKKIIILSTVRSNSGGWIGFLKDKRRLNVALTRARDGLFVVGNQETLKKAATNGNGWRNRGGEQDPDDDPAVWKQFLTWCEERGLVKEWT